MKQNKINFNYLVNQFDIMHYASMHGKIDIVHDLIKNHNFTINHCSMNKQSILLNAV